MRGGSEGAGQRDHDLALKLWKAQPRRNDHHPHRLGLSDMDLGGGWQRRD
jgi:hypothetical protein